MPVCSSRYGKSAAIYGTLTMVCLGSMARVQSEPLRFATFNLSLHRRESGQLLRDLSGGQDPQARRLAAIIQVVNPHVILLNEIDASANARPADRGAAKVRGTTNGELDLFADEYLARGQFGQAAVRFPYRFRAAVNTGIPSQLDLDGDDRSDGPGDAWGFGSFPGQYGMAVLSRLPIDASSIRTFQTFRWRDMLKPKVPRRADHVPFYAPEVWSQLRLSSKSHWDVPILVGSRAIHFLVCHPTPPVFDGDEDRNGCRNGDEIRFWTDYIDPAQGQHVYDDQHHRGCLTSGASFVIAGDLNSDPLDGDSRHADIQGLLHHHQVRDPRPASAGGARASQSQGKGNLRHQTDPRLDTSDFADDAVGNLRVDYVLPSRDLKILRSGVFWPVEGELGHDWIQASDHRLVWVDVE